MKSIKVVLFDVDGVVISSERISQTLATKYSLPIEKTLTFFQEDLIPCLLGKESIRRILPNYIDTWKWTDGLDDFISVWLEESREVNSRVISLAEYCTQKGIPCYLATNQEEIRTKFLFSEMKLNNHFEQIFSSCSAGAFKPSIAFFDYVMDELTQSIDVNRNEILLIDDSKKNITGAIDYGLRGYLFQDDKSDYQKIKKII